MWPSPSPQGLFAYDVTHLINVVLISALPTELHAHLDEHRGEPDWRGQPIRVLGTTEVLLQ